MRCVVGGGGSSDDSGGGGHGDVTVLWDEMARRWLGKLMCRCGILCYLEKLWGVVAM